MNKQEILNLVIKAVLDNPVKSQARPGGGRCEYRGPNGARCFVGFLIPDEDYRPEMEGKCILDAYEHLPNLLEGILPSDVEPHEGIQFLGELQNIHDNSPIIFWGSKLKMLATNHNLSVPQRF